MTQTQRPLRTAWDGAKGGVSRMRAPRRGILWHRNGSGGPSLGLSIQQRCGEARASCRGRQCLNHFALSWGLSVFGGEGAHQLACLKCVTEPLGRDLPARRGLSVEGGSAWGTWPCMGGILPLRGRSGPRPRPKEGSPHRSMPRGALLFTPTSLRSGQLLCS